MENKCDLPSRRGPFLDTTSVCFDTKMSAILDFEISEIPEIQICTLSPITFEDGSRSTSNCPQKKARPFAELGKKTALQTNVVFLAAVGLFWTPLVCFDTKMSAILDLQI